LDCLYTGTVTFGSSDGLAGLPANYTFTKGDTGSHTFTATLNTTGSQTLTVTDTVHSTITATASVTVNPAGAAAPTAGGRSDRAATTSSASADASRAAALASLLADNRVLENGPVGQHAPGSANSPGGGAVTAADRVVATSTPARAVSVAAWTRIGRRSRASDELVEWSLTLADVDAFFTATALSGSG
jgi:hypothetical protein